MAGTQQILPEEKTEGKEGARREKEGKEGEKGGSKGRRWKQRQQDRSRIEAARDDRSFLTTGEERTPRPQGSSGAAASSGSRRGGRQP